MKAEGVRQGVADVFLPWPVYEKQTVYVELEGESKFDIGELITRKAEVNRIRWCGLYVEMKKPSLKPKSSEAKGGLSDEQIEFASYAKRNGYGWIVCYSWREAATAIQDYIEWGN